MDIIGKKFDHWTVLELVPEKKNGMWYVRCQCDCGRTKITRKYEFESKTHSNQCFRCNIKVQKNQPFTSSK